MKRILSLVMVLLLSFALLAGCGGSEDATSSQAADAGADGFSTAKVNYIAEDGSKPLKKGDFSNLPRRKQWQN